MKLPSDECRKTTKWNIEIVSYIVLVLFGIKQLYETKLAI